MSMGGSSGFPRMDKTCGLMTEKWENELSKSKEKGMRGRRTLRAGLSAVYESMNVDWPWLSANRKSFKRNL